MKKVTSRSPYYEVSFEISTDDPYNFHQWLREEHVLDLINLKHDFGSGLDNIFDGFEIGSERQDEGSPTKVVYLRCFASDLDRIEVYIQEYLPVMREKGMEHHGAGLQNGEIKILGVKMVVERESFD